jgi:serine phosphatase RsbU (regulator of sigma subunit)
MTVTFPGYRLGTLGVQVWWRQTPASGRLGGDWIDVTQVPGGRLALTIGDACGHDDQAAALAGVLRAVMHAALLDGLEPDEVLSGALSEVAALGDMEEMFATAFVAVVEPATGIVTYANAGHPAPVLVPGSVSRRQPVRELNPTGPVLSDLFAGTRLWSSRQIALTLDDRLVAYTDGITEARDVAGRLFGTDWFLADRRRTVSPDQLLTSLYADVDEYRADRPCDDRSAAVLTRVGLPAPFLGTVPAPRSSLTSPRQSA